MSKCGRFAQLFGPVTIRNAFMPPGARPQPIRTILLLFKSPDLEAPRLLDPNSGLCLPNTGESYARCPSEVRRGAPTFPA